MRRTRVLVAVSLVVLAVVAPGAAGTSSCSSALSVFARVEVADVRVGGVNPNPVACLVGAGDVDARLLPPLTAEVSVRLARDLGASVSSASALLHGGGFSAKILILERVVDPVFQRVSYDSSFVRLPDAPMISGTIRVVLLGYGPDWTCYRTPDRLSC